VDDFTRYDRYLEERLDGSLAELAALVAQPSVAAQGIGLEPCARMVAGMLERRGFRAEILPTGGAPAVVAERDGATGRTLLIYNHYDVQPAEPLERWTSPPFAAERRDGRMFGRGVSDDKGHLTARLHALDALLALDGDLPCRVKWVIEGEEEVGSVHLPGLIRRERARLAADACLWEFGAVDHRDVPQLYAGLRGICYVELSVKTAELDIHSGLGGSIIANAAWRLTWALASLKDRDERILIPGHYDDVRPPTARDRELLATIPDHAGEYRRRYGVASFLRGVEGGAALHAQEVFEPTCTICGLTAGYQGAGSKTVLPALASAKVDFRLVPDQRPEKVVAALRAHLDAQGFDDVHVEPLGGEPAGRTDPDDPFLRLVSRTATDVYGTPMQVVPMIGGSGPNHVFIHTLGVPVACAGLGYPDTRAHAPDENIRVDLYLKHARHVVRMMKAFARGEDAERLAARG
jgi:acetylornithine deacetylase/succinyl-diaminopimelate desuccinylase-like protein